MEAARLGQSFPMLLLHFNQNILEKHPQRGGLVFSYQNKSEEKISHG